MSPTMLIPTYLAAVNALTFVIFGIDKHRARRNASLSSAGSQQAKAEGRQTNGSQQVKAEGRQTNSSQQAKTEAHHAPKHQAKGNSRSRKEKRRTPESSLMTLALIGGSVGALAAMKLFHHKTRHKKFTIGVPLILALQLALAAYVLAQLYL